MITSDNFLFFAVGTLVAFFIFSILLIVRDFYKLIGKHEDMMKKLSMIENQYEGIKSRIRALEIEVKNGKQRDTEWNWSCVCRGSLQRPRKLHRRVF